MQFFIDTADPAEIRKAAALGILDGVTTNPSLIAKTGRPFADVMREIFALVPGPISLVKATIPTSPIKTPAPSRRVINKAP